MTDRIPHPVTSVEAAVTNRRTICDPRGYCGPFINEEYYASFGSLWAGMAECIYCGNTVHLSVELERWERSLWLRRFAVELL